MVLTEGSWVQSWYGGAMVIRQLSDFIIETAAHQIGNLPSLSPLFEFFYSNNHLYIVNMLKFDHSCHRVTKPTMIP